MRSSFSRLQEEIHAPPEQCPPPLAKSTPPSSLPKAKSTAAPGVRDNDAFNDEPSIFSASVISTSSEPMANSESEGQPSIDDPVLAEREQKVVLWSRFLLLVVLVIAAAALAVAMYLIVSRNEKDTFESQFRSYASEVMALSHQNAQTAIDAIDSFGNTLSNIATSTNSSWPFVTILNYPAMADKVSQICKAENIALLPVVKDDQYAEWSNYYDQNAEQVFQEAIEFEGLDYNTSELMALSEREIYNINWTTKPISRPLPQPGTGPYAPLWQVHTLFISGLVFQNYNMIDMNSSPRIGAAFEVANATKVPSISEVLRTDPDDTTKTYPKAQIMQPIFDDASGTKNTSELNVVGALWVMMDWRNMFLNLLPEGADGIYLVIRSTCNGHSVQGDKTFTYTYQINGLDAVALGVGDLHDPAYDYLEMTAPFVNLQYDNSNINEGSCIGELVISLYPSQEFEESFNTNNDIIYTLGVIAIFAFTTAVFLVYEYAIRRRQQKVMERVIRQHRIVSNMFPAEFRDRLYGDDSSSRNHKSATGLDIEFGGECGSGGAPLAELYPQTTVVFADICGFTAWSSQREPIQVFDLLESLYAAFDKIAHRTQCYKVETVGDCYVACAGLPTPRVDHAVLVCKFARECLSKMDELTRQLEVQLGPDTTELQLRLGIHSGQVTAGILRGERSRFQLFGDCVNTAARMEATSARGKIQVSSTTAEELTKAKKEHWIRPRDAKISVKGKGEMQTYWLKTKEEAKLAQSLSRRASNGTLPALDEHSETSAHDDDDVDLFLIDNKQTSGAHKAMNKTQRLVEWNVETLGFLLKQILAARPVQFSVDGATMKRITVVEQELMGNEGTVLDEFQEIITLPEVDKAQIAKRKDPHSIQLEEAVIGQLRELISEIASMYQANNFHNFEHASHVTSSVRKLLSRIVTADTSMLAGSSETVQLVDSAGHSFGIASDPLTQFAVVFSAVIHDADHPGVTNAQLVKEKTQNAQRYKKSIAEQNSVDLVWALLMQPRFQDLRACIYSSEDELRRFRQLVVNTVMATDIADKELGALRKARWATAFNESLPDSTLSLDVNRKATIVIEHLIQASDVSHTMQHWHVYKRWNEHFFMECYGAYKSGRVEIDPSVGWYKGEIGFFDFYVIPLAKKLDSCGVFGVSSHEYLNYATANRNEWIIEGEDVVAEFLRKYAEMEEKGLVDGINDDEEVALGALNASIEV